MSRKITLIMMCFVVGIAFLPEMSDAISVPKITLDKESYTFNDPEKAYVSGDIYPACGQTINLYASDKRTTIGSAKLAHDGGRGSFSMKVSGNLLAGKDSIRLYVRSNSAKGVTASKFIEITISKEKPVASTKPASVKTATKAKSAAAKKAVKKSSASNKKKKVNTKKKSKKNSSRPAAVTVVTNKLKNGKKPTAAEGREAAAAWARWIAADDRFTYGPPPYSKHNGCYFCGTNGRKKRDARHSRWANGYKGKKWDRTYCCNTFVHACYAHGAQHPRVLKYCKKKQAVDMTRASYRKMKCFKYMGKPSFSKLKTGDIFVNSYHLWIYVGKGQLAEATTVGHGKVNWGANTIRIRNNAKKRYRGCSYVMRFTGY